MSKMQEAFELEFGLRDNGEKYWQESSAFFKSWCAFQKGYQAAIADVKSGGPHSYALKAPDRIPLYKLPEDV